MALPPALDLSAQFGHYIEDDNQITMESLKKLFVLQATSCRQ